MSCGRVGCCCSGSGTCLDAYVLTHSRPYHQIANKHNRKLWAKMREGDWRTATKAFYVLHRFAANGAPEQAPNFQMRCVSGVGCWGMGVWLSGCLYVYGIIDAQTPLP